MHHIHLLFIFLQKENKEAIVSRMQAIHQQFQTKADITMVEQHALQPIQTLRQDVARISVAEEVLERLVKQQQEVTKQVRKD